MTRNETIIAMRKAGKWPSEIRRELGVSRNVVAGALNRAGLCDPNVDRAAVQPRGEAHWSSKLTADRVRVIRRFHVSGNPILGAAAFARRYGVGPKAVREVILRKTWAHVE